MFLAWRYGGENPYCLYHGLTADFRPWEDPAAPPRPPRFPHRLREFIYGLAIFVPEAEGGEEKRKRPRRPTGD